MNSSVTGKRLALTGACMQLGPLIGLVGTVVGMRRAFQALDASGSDVGALGDAVGEVLVATSIGLAVGLIGVVLLLVSMIGCRYRAKWLFWFLMVYGGISLFAFPAGTAIGVMFLVYGLANRGQFLTTMPPRRPPEVE